MAEDRPGFATQNRTPKSEIVARVAGHARRDTLAVYQHVALDGDLERKYQEAMRQVDL